MKQSTKQENTAPKEIPFRKLSFEALPEMWTYQILSGLILVVPAVLLTELIRWVAGIGGDVFTTATFWTFILSWRFPVILFLGLLLVMLFLTLELLSQIYLTDDILNGRQAGIRRSIGRGVRSLKRFLNPYGIGVILFILIAVPLSGVGFTISVSKAFYIPNFILNTMMKNPFLAAGFIALIVYLVWFVFRSSFTLHAILLDEKKPSEGRKYSSRIVKENRWRYLKGLFLTGLVILAVNLAAVFLFTRMPDWILGGAGEVLPKNYTVDLIKAVRGGRNLSATDMEVTGYRSAAAFLVLTGKYMISVVALLSGAYFMLRLSRYYLEFTGRGRQLWAERPKKSRYRWKVIMIAAIFALFFLVSIAIGVFYNRLFTDRDPVKIVAHRAGGSLASENSIDGLEKAVGHGCYGCEIDIQRTKDGCYIINHDNDFKRLTGVEKAPADMTMEEVRKLRIKDTTGSGKELPVATLEEMLDVIKGRGKLFIEMKGPTTDRQMVDDVVRMIRERDCVEDTALISLNYDVIKYAETTYPEFETGTLFFASLGDVSKLTCDLMIMEEEAAIRGNIDEIHRAGKQAIVWTVNTRDKMYHFLDSEIDAVITDEILLAEEVQKELDDRTDLEVLEDKLSFE